MREFDYVIIGGGCSGLSLAYELEINKMLDNKSLAIIEPRQEYKRDKTWSFWKVCDHNFDDCVIKSWNTFTINTYNNSNELKSQKFPYQSINSGMFYNKVNSKLSSNSNISFFKNLNELDLSKSIVFNSVIESEPDRSDLWQHFQGFEIETQKDIFDDSIINLMDFDCEQRDEVHFFYTLPFSKNRALIETTWISNLEDKSLMNYDFQLENYIKKNLGIKNYQIKFTERGAIPLSRNFINRDKKKINIGSAGGMTRLSTGYTFLNIQNQSKYIIENLNNLEKIHDYKIGKKYEILDKLFLKVLKNNPRKMPEIFYNMFKGSTDSVIKFLSNKSNIFEDINIILKMPKWLFIKELINNDKY